MQNDEAGHTHALTEESEQQVVHSCKDEQTALSCSLVLSATDISHHVTPAADGLHLTVTPSDVPEAEKQIRAYLYENRNWPPKPVTPDSGFNQLLQPPTLLLIGALALFYSVTGPWSGDSHWFAIGAGDADAILQKGEWYRLITALTLHANGVHLLGNCIFGGFLFHFFCRLTGNGLGLFAMLVTAVLGNFINVFLHGGTHHFVGFSTAVFAIIGMLAMFSRYNRIRTGYLTVMPIMAGAAFLAMIGSSGEHTDLGAHFFGLLSGLAGGWFLTRAPLLKLRQSPLFQSVLFLFFLAGIIIAWKFALNGTDFSR